MCYKGNGIRALRGNGLAKAIEVKDGEMAVQSMDSRTVLKWLAVIASAIWISVTIYQEFIEIDPTQYGFRSPEVEARMKACGGSFQQRYECKEAVIIAKGHDSFVIWMEKVALILGPPIVVAILIGRVGRERREPVDSHTARRTTPVARRRSR
jgi:hypothetical protein